uniref:E2 NEDD8-conjugating enzyme n=1 Tax=Steinernema glaseri TaxID=37863 RepID=A0A1I7Y0Z8_9BILA
MLNLPKCLNGVNIDPNRTRTRDKLLAQEAQELQKKFRNDYTCRVTFPEPTQLHKMELTLRPVSGMYAKGIFKFSIFVPPEYNNVPPIVECKTRMWHPHINEEGKIRLSILRVNGPNDSSGWSPMRRILKVILALFGLFRDPISFDDPLNEEAAKQYKEDPDSFKSQVQNYIKTYCENGHLILF